MDKKLYKKAEKIVEIFVETFVDKEFRWKPGIRDCLKNRDKNFYKEGCKIRDIDDMTLNFAKLCKILEYMFFL